VASKAAKLGDYLRYAHYDKYFKKIGNCIGYNQCQAGSGKNSAHYLISWYFSWGGGLQGDWSWRYGSSHIHSGYQNPLTAWILSTEKAFKPKSSSAVKDWATSMDRQLEFLRWLQASEGCIAGGATNSWQGHYAEPSEDVSSFYGMWYDWQPVYHNPPSNNWTGMQGRVMERVCSLYYISGNEKAGLICKNWIYWLKLNLRVSGGEIVHTTNLQWEGTPDDWRSANFNKYNLNSSLHGTASSEGLDLGVATSMAKALFWYSMKDNDDKGLMIVRDIVDAVKNYADELGYSDRETHEEYDHMFEETYIPAGWVGKNAQGATIKSGVTFIDIRPKYKQDPDWAQVEDYYNGGGSPEFRYHRFWAQTEIMITNGLMEIYDNYCIPAPPAPPPAKKINLTRCSSKITAQGYRCCTNGCEVVYTDDDGDWAVENGDWCGCGIDTSCNPDIVAMGYPCCQSCGKIYYEDEDGEWGVEDNKWCGMKYKCSIKEETQTQTQTQTSKSYYC